jgi:dihydroorotase
VTDLRKCYKTLEMMQEVDMPLLVHGEVTDQDIDLFDREAVFIERVMRPLRRDFPELNIVFEHITTRDAAQYVAEAEGPIAATITAHHLLYNRNEIFKGGINPHYYCLPVLKREEHRLALVTAATSGDERFFLGTDSAPHARARQGKRLRLRRLLHGPARDGAVRHRFRTGRCAGQAGSLRQPEWPGLLRPAGERGHVTLKREAWTIPDRADGRAPAGAAQRRPAASTGRCCKQGC